MQAAAGRLLNSLFTLEKWVAITAFAVVTVCLFADVLGRELFGQGIFWAQRVSVYGASIAGLLGFALCTARGGHLRPSSFDKLFPAALNEPVNRIADLVSFGICMFLATYGTEFVVNSFRLGERGQALDMPLWPVQIILPYCFASAGLRYLLFAFFPALRPAESEVA